MGIMCIKQISLWYVIKTEQYQITMDSDGAVTINGDAYTDLDFSAFIDEYIYMKKVTSLFYMIRGYGFKILYDPNGRIYIILEPYFKDGVSFKVSLLSQKIV